MNYAFCIILHTVLDVSEIGSFVIGLVRHAKPIPEEIFILLFKKNHSCTRISRL